MTPTRAAPTTAAPSGQQGTPSLTGCIPDGVYTVFAIHCGGPSAQTDGAAFVIFDGGTRLAIGSSRAGSVALTCAGAPGSYSVTNTVSIGPMHASTWRVIDDTPTCLMFQSETPGDCGDGAPGPTYIDLVGPI